MQERNQDTLSLILDDPDSSPTFVFIFFFFSWTECFFFSPKSSALSFRSGISAKGRICARAGCAPGVCAGILGFVKFKSVTYGAATESGRDVEGESGEKLWIGFTARAEIHGTRDL